MLFSRFTGKERAIYSYLNGFQTYGSLCRLNCRFWLFRITEFLHFVLQINIKLLTLQWLLAKWHCLASVWNCLAPKSIQIVLLPAKKRQTFQFTMDFSPVAVIGGSLAVIGGLLYPMELLYQLAILEMQNKNSTLAELGKLIQLSAVDREKFGAQLSISTAMR